MGHRPLRGNVLDNNAIVIADAGGTIRYWSAGAEKAFGHAAWDALGRTLDIIVPEEYRPAHWRGFRKAIAAGAAAAEGQATPFPVLRADGEIAVTRGLLTFLRDPSGRVIAAAVTFETGAAASR